MVMHDVACHHCGKAFQAKNTGAKWCTTSCRVMGNRAAKAGKLTPAQKAGSLPSNVVTLRPHPNAKPTAEANASASAAALAATAEALEAGGPITGATRAKLASSGRTDTPDGQVALNLAARLDRSMAETGSAAASLATAHAKAMDRALANVQAAGDVLDGLQDLAAKVMAAVAASEVVEATMHVESTAPAPVEALG